MARPKPRKRNPGTVKNVIRIRQAREEKVARKPGLARVVKMPEPIPEFPSLFQDDRHFRRDIRMLATQSFLPPGAVAKGLKMMEDLIKEVPTKTEKARISKHYNTLLKRYEEMDRETVRDLQRFDNEYRKIEADERVGLAHAEAEKAKALGMVNASQGGIPNVVAAECKAMHSAMLPPEILSVLNTEDDEPQPAPLEPTTEGNVNA